MIHFPLLKAYRVSGNISYAHIGCWSSNVCLPLEFVIFRSFYHLPELNRIGESIQAWSFIENNCHQNQCVTKLQHALAHLSVASWMLLTFAVRFWSLSLELSPSSIRPVSQPFIWHYIYVQAPGTKIRRDSLELKKQEANKYPRKITDPCY